MKLEQFIWYRPRKYAALVCCALLALTHAVSADAGKGRSREENPLLGQLREVFQRQNPAIKHVAILDLQSLLYDEVRYVLIGWGITEDRSFHGDLGDELFGVFVVDPSLMEITRVIDIMPSPRWQDFGLSIESIAWDSVIVVGKGLTYRDHAVRKAYAWKRVFGPDE